MKKLISLAVLAAVLGGCYGNSGGTYGTEGYGEEALTTDSSSSDAYLLAAAPKYYIGSAYKVDNTQYVPTEDMYYNQTGVAGIIPHELNGTKTSNGETFDANQMVATSKTLPLPTIARITNLNNGESVVVRINNRGPFVNTRIADLSPAAAAKIGLNGTAKVQIQVLADQSLTVKNATLGTGTGGAAMTSVENDTPATVSSAGGEYSVQLAAFYAQDAADQLAARMRNYGETSVIKEGDMFKVRITGLDAAGARQTIDALRTNEGMAPGLLLGGKWVNADSI